MKKIKNSVFGGMAALLGLVMLQACNQVPLLDPKGPIGLSERFVIISAIALMLIVVIPVAIMTLLFPWKYRATNARADYAPKWSRSLKIELIIWLVPAVIVTILSLLVWTTTHQLDPYKPIDAGVAPIHIEAVSLDWKWLFIYPDQNIAAVNQLVFPANVPLSFRITSDTVMTSFFIPQLGSQIYAMAGMQTRLHLLANEPGTYIGQNQQFSGRGYADMTFKAIATSREAYAAWIQKVKQAPEKLDLARYKELEEPSVGSPVTLFSSVRPRLFDDILRKYDKSVKRTPDPKERESDSRRLKPGAPKEG